MDTQKQQRTTLEILTTGRQYGEFNIINGYMHAPNLEHIKLKNGVRLSIQAADGMYCTPRDNYGPWFEVEVGVFGAKRPIKSFGSRWETQRKGKYAESRWYLYPWCSLKAVMAYIDRIGIAEVE